MRGFSRRNCEIAGGSAVAEIDGSAAITTRPAIPAEISLVCPTSASCRPGCARPRAEGRGRSGQPHGASAAVEERRADGFLELGDSRAQGRL
jgi:hypothetical protein